jgi:hypothetical protein
MAAVGICLFIVGLASGAAGIFVYIKKRVINKPDDRIDMVEQYGENPNYNNDSGTAYENISSSEPSDQS